MVNSVMSLGGLSLQGLIHRGAYFRKFTVLVNSLGSNFFLCWFFFLAKFHQFKQLFVIRCFHFLFPHYFY